MLSSVTRVDGAGPSHSLSHYHPDEEQARRHAEQGQDQEKGGGARQQQPATTPRLTRQALSKSLGLSSRSRTGGSLTQRIEIWLDEVIAATQPGLPPTAPPCDVQGKKPARGDSLQDHAPRPKRGADRSTAAIAPFLGAASAPAVIETRPWGGVPGMTAGGEDGDGVETPGGAGAKAQGDRHLAMTTPGCGPFSIGLRKFTLRLHIGRRKNQEPLQTTQMYSTPPHQLTTALDEPPSHHHEQPRHTNRIPIEDGAATSQDDGPASMEQTLGSVSRSSVVSSDRRSTALRERQERLKRARRLLDQTNSKEKAAGPS